MKRDDLGNTALLCAVENRNFTVAAFLAKISPWHTVNKAGRTFLRAVEIVECHGSENKAAKIVNETLAKEVQTNIVLYISALSLPRPLLASTSPPYRSYRTTRQTPPTTGLSPSTSTMRPAHP
jgi:hypothetical protein